MNIYKVWTDYFCYDGSDGFVVLASTETDAINQCVGEWGDAEGCEVKVALIGKVVPSAKEYVEFTIEEDKQRGIILCSFNAG